MKNRKVILRYVSFLLFFAAVSGAIWQLWFIISQYMKYETVTKTTIERPDKLVPPSVAICRGIIEKNASIAKHFAAAFHDGDIVNFSIFSDDESHVYGNSTELLLQNFLITKLIRKEAACYHIRLNRTTPIDAALLYEGVVNTIFGIMVSDQFTNDSELALYFLPNDTLFFNPQVDVIVASGTSNVSEKIGRTFTYAQYTSIRLPPPYDTMCIDYSAITPVLDGAAECYDICLEQEYRKHTKKPVFFKTYFAETDSLNNEIRDTDERDKSWSAIRRAAIESCRKSCRYPSCSGEDYAPRYMSSGLSRYAYIVLNAPLEPRFRSVATAKISEIDLITQLLSCISFWFALSPVNLGGIDVYRYMRTTFSRRRESHARISHAWHLVRGHNEMMM